MLTARTKQNKVLKNFTLRDFTGGWNVLDDDLNLSPKFSTRMFNVYRHPDGSVAVRYGVRLFKDLSDVWSTPGTWIVNLEYYNNSLIVVGSNGEIAQVLGDGTATIIWDATAAAALPGSPDPWSATSFVSFAHFNGSLILCNGIDKPLIIDESYFVDYLQDPASGSNINTPIAKYVVAVDRYLVMAGDPTLPTTLHISSRDTSGVWYGDPDPNDGTQVEVGSYLPNSSDIRGLGVFRGKLIVGFAEGTIVGDLGIYNADGTVHTPEFNDAVEQYGTVSHRTMLSYGDDMLMMDQVGIPSLKRTVFTGTIRPERASDFIDTEIASDLNDFSFTTLDERTFSVYNQREGQFFFFIPNNDAAVSTTETKCYVYTYRPSMDVQAWSRFDGWNFTCACRSITSNVFFGDRSSKIWLYGSKDDPITADFEDDPDLNDGEGTAIVYDWELPWLDLNNRVRTKNSKYIMFDVRGSGPFTAKMYVDQITEDGDGNDEPALSMEFYGGGTLGFGGGDQPFGGGRQTNYTKNYAWPAKFQIMKLRIQGSTEDQLRFVSISMMYHDGSINR